MDLFFNSLATPRKSRMHFHRMMSRIHAQLKAMHNATDPLDRVAADIARDASVLCFDEFFVSDIADAMLLGRLLDGLIRRGVTLVATSNTAPSELYANGLQRERFLPAIALLERHTEVIHIGEGPDYRLRLLQRAGTYLTPDDARAEARLAKFFHDSAATTGAVASTLDILGRPIPARGVAGDVAWFDFAALCDGPRSPEDYIEIARRFQTVILSGVPQLRAEQDNAARRFISMIDEFYDRRVKLVLSAAVPIDSLYRGTRLSAEFRRTASRLQEMQSGDYLHMAHRG
jgi:cell division protein ZapE